MKTILSLAIEHDRDLPALAAEIIAARTYDYLQAAGVRADVTFTKGTHYPSDHVCGAQGFNPMLGDECPGCTRRNFHPTSADDQTVPAREGVCGCDYCERLREVTP